MQKVNMDRNNTISEKHIAAIDIGSFKISLAVAKIECGNTQILFYDTVPSAGIRDSAIFNPMQAGKTIRGLINKAEDELKIKILQVVVGLPKYGIREENADAIGSRSNPDDCITAEEIECLKQVAQDTHEIKNPDKEQIYGAIAQSFSTPDYIGLSENDIVGMISDEVTGNFKVFIGKRNAINILYKVFNDLGIAIAKMYFSPLAAAKAVLTEEEIQNGVALIDLGAQVTSVSVYHNKVLSHYAAIPFGGDTITTDISTECTISKYLAENIKCAFGGCIPDKLQTLGEKILQIESDDISSCNQIPVHYLSEIITEREKEIIDAMLYEIEASGLSENLRRGIVITGGGAKMINIGNYIKELSGYNVRTAYPINRFICTGCEDILDISAVTTAGMILMSKELNIDCCVADDTAVCELGLNLESSDSEAHVGSAEALWTNETGISEIGTRTETECGEEVTAAGTETENRVSAAEMTDAASDDSIGTKTGAGETATSSDGGNAADGDNGRGKDKSKDKTGTAKPKVKPFGNLFKDVKMKWADICERIGNEEI